jgi:DNA-directed RNA polymerase subunit M/transcription elongation factor TFIIS
MKCEHCGQENPAGFKFCENCGEALVASVHEIACTACSHLNQEDMKFCEECGARLDILTCLTCAHENPRDFKFCEECGSSLKVQTAVNETRPEPKPTRSRVRTSRKKERTISAAAPEKEDVVRSPIFVRPGKRRGRSIWSFLARTALRSLAGSILGFLAGKAGVWIANMLFASI